MPLRTFRDLPDANRQLREWIMQEASVREHGTTREQQLAPFAYTEFLAMLMLVHAGPIIKNA